MTSLRRRLWMDFVAVLAISLVIIVPMQFFLFNVVVDKLWPIKFTAQGMITRDASTFLVHVTATVFVLVMVGIVYATLRGKISRGPYQAAEFKRKNWGVWTLGWFMITLAVNGVFFVYPGMAGLMAMWDYHVGVEGKSPLIVDVVAHQWGWSVSYPQFGVYGVGQLELPIHKTAKIMVTSQDVFHSFWVPAFGFKLSAIPGEDRAMYATPIRLGTGTALVMANFKNDGSALNGKASANNYQTGDPLLRVQCSWDCGMGHPVMRFPANVVTWKDFKSWAKGAQIVNKAIGDGSHYF
jgi:cytochrome c oxidase subunit II